MLVAYDTNAVAIGNAFRGGWKHYDASGSTNAAARIQGLRGSFPHGTFRQNNDGPGWTGNLGTPTKQYPIPFVAVSGFTAYTLTSITANITFLGKSHTPIIGRFLSSAVANVTFLGKSHGMAKGFALTSAVANITFLGKSHTPTLGRFLATTKANITFLGKSHTPTVGRLLASSAANITFLGKSHDLVYTPGAPPTVHYTLTSIVANITFLGKSHEMVYVDLTPAPLTELHYHPRHAGGGFMHLPRN